MFIFYGEDAHMSGDNDGNVHQTGLNWSAGGDVLAANPAAVNDLCAIQGRGPTAAAGATAAPIMTATSMNGQLFPRALDAINHAKSDGDWASLSAQEKTDVETTKTAITTWQGAQNDANRNAIAVAAGVAIHPTDGNHNNILNPARSTAIKSMVELLADIRNAGTDNSRGQRNIYGDHVYTVMTVSFKTTDGKDVPLSAIPANLRPVLFPLVDTNVSNVVMRNPHGTNEPDINADRNPDDGSADDGTFTFNLEQFFRNFTSIETGTFSRTGS